MKFFWNDANGLEKKELVSILRELMSNEVMQRVIKNINIKNTVEKKVWYKYSFYFLKIKCLKLKWYNISFDINKIECKIIRFLRMLKNV